MRVHATLHGFPVKERELELPEGALADDAPRALDIHPELVLVFRGDRPLPGDAPLVDGDRIRVLRVVSGGREDWRVVKGALLGLSLAWLVGVGAFGARAGIAQEWLLAYAAAVVAFALLGAAGFARPSVRYPAGIAAAVLMLVVAWLTFTQLLILAGVFGVVASIVLPPDRR